MIHQRKCWGISQLYCRALLTVKLQKSCAGSYLLAWYVFSLNATNAAAPLA
jgi:hypothetical protein